MNRMKHFLSGLALVIDTLAKTIPEISYMILLWFLTATLLVTFGCTFFASEDTPMTKSYSNFMEGLWTAFVILTQDGWRIKVLNFIKSIII